MGYVSPAKYRNDFRQEGGGILTEMSVPKGAIRRCEIQGEERHQGKTAEHDKKMILKQHNFTGHSLPYLQYFGEFLSGSMPMFFLKIAPKYDIKTLSVHSVFNC